MDQSNKAISNSVQSFTISVTASQVTLPSQTSQGEQFHILVGAWGDSASRANTGVEAEIQTHTYTLRQSDSANSFSVRNLLANGAFAAFGYWLQKPGAYCLLGYVIGGHNTCTGGSDVIGNSDARWYWQYNTNTTAFYYGIGPPGSVGVEGTWHHYSIMPHANNFWSFVLDGQVVGSVPFRWMRSTAPALMEGEQDTASSQLDGLGPVQFRNLAYLPEIGGSFRPVTSLAAIVSCVNQLSVTCNFDIPYGVSLATPSDPNTIIVGQGVTKTADGQPLIGSFATVQTTSGITMQMLSTSQTTASNVTSPSPPYVGIILLILVAAGVIAVIFLVVKGAKSLSRRLTAKQESKKSTVSPAKRFCVECGAELPVGSEFCNKCGQKQP
jgi:ribosomal protein L40E